MAELLDTISYPEDLRGLDAARLPDLAEELRGYLLESLSETGGHLGANLGTVELTLALHYTFQTPHDRLVWDVGHQAYVHKLLTGRRESFGTIRQAGGLSGFPKRAESPYDTFGVGHASTSISAALGMAQASAAQGEERAVAAIIGDGAMTAGMAFEALNHAGDLNANLLVILNDNEMSISPNVGALSQRFSRLIAGRWYNRMRDNADRALSRIPGARDIARRAEEHFKGLITPGTLFEELGFNYVGPVDGHNLDELLPILGNLRGMEGPRLLHVVTRKGKGFEPAENEPTKYHGVTPFDPATGAPRKSGGGAPAYTKVFGDALIETAAADERVTGITPAMREGSGLVEFEQRFPERFFDVGIAEQHALTFAAGQACEGLRPVVAIYSTFLQRAYDQLIHDIAIQNLPVVFAIDRAGIVGPDGPTHGGNFDLSFLRPVPNLTLMTPANEVDLRNMLATGLALEGPSALRYPKDKAVGLATSGPPSPLEVGRAEVVREGSGGQALLVFGPFIGPALEAAEERDATVVNMRFVKPLDTALLTELAATHRHLVTVEENTLAGGAGEAVRAFLASLDPEVRVTCLGLPDAFIPQGERTALLGDYGLDAAGMTAALRAHTAPRPVARECPQK
ncbi:1-deoxy-D-xylulose-5-phosphate synthase [Thiohalorhabdus denitrificans]|uniref:1-deoxy-D-xylulose-5-phosphate synthase n=1 Tax=Thiohalorhabdus denitrificans TaxID=381306 RepID=A0A0P9CMH3_9GAMM|nr:1-deoxy-D-xylulose-5-phosphate synthase [Thiohalorhabdus denitrificans]KPV40271.1 1-deoxy-D-xylulose-5-phosphate synthase [Thiohalorhabdus denitrificans]SCX81811.1 1-deoxy-D-xylulose-5-phosphate synthase [Thiohalorhabdus denitrificans]